MPCDRAALDLTIACVATAMAGARDPWWIIASAAIALHGVDPGPAGDVDVLLSCADARWFAMAHGAPIAHDDGNTRFRSALFARWTMPPLPVELMADFAVATPDGWVPIRPRSRITIATAGGPAYILDRDDLIAMLRLFDRPKDRQRLRLLESDATNSLGSSRIGTARDV